MMTRKKKVSKPGKAAEAKPVRVRSTAEETFAFWDEENMREARPISIEIDREGDPEEK